jgi:hypothetical protein
MKDPVENSLRLLPAWRSLSPSLALWTVVAACAPGSAPPAATVLAGQCVVTAADLTSNRQLDYEAFDQTGTSRSTARKLSESGCYLAAAEVGKDYLLHGPTLTDYQRNNVRWHLAQNLGMAGRDAEAALLMSGARRGVDPNRPTFDWDAYVVGSYAFLVKDRAMLDAMANRLAVSDQAGNRSNGRVLRRFQKCFFDPYRVAYGEERCAVPATAPHAR